MYPRSCYMSIAFNSCKKIMILCGKIVVWSLGNPSKSHDLVHSETFATCSQGQDGIIGCKLGSNHGDTSLWQSRWVCKLSLPLLLWSVQMVLRLHLLLFSKAVAITSNGSRITQLMHREPCLFFVVMKTNQSIQSGIFKKRMDWWRNWCCMDRAVQQGNIKERKWRISVAACRWT